MLIPGVVASGQGGGGGYVAKAVHFDGATVLKNTSLAALDGRYFSGAFWWKAAAYNNGVLGIGDPENAYTNVVAFSITGEDPAIVCDNFDESSEFEFYNDSDATPPLATWHSAIFAADVDFSAGNKIGVIYVDRVKVDLDITDTAAAFSMIFNGLPFWIGSDGVSFANGDFADVRLLPGINLLTGNDIASATLDLFATSLNKPVDPAIATASLGAPCMLFSGDAAGFPTNQGTGGAFTLTGTLTNASSSPSD